VVGAPSSEGFLIVLYFGERFIHNVKCICIIKCQLENPTGAEIAGHPMLKNLHTYCSKNWLVTIAIALHHFRSICKQTGSERDPTRLSVEFGITT